MYLEDKLFLSNYLLTSQGDRMAMAHSVEIRPPYLDFRIIDLMSRVPPHWKVFGLDEKHVLKRAFKDVLPASVIGRTKHPYRAPIQQAFAGRLASGEYAEAISEKGIREAGLFDPDKVGRLVRKVNAGESTSETEGMALAGILSTQFLDRDFVHFPPARSAAPERWDIHIDKRGRRTP